MKCYGRKLKKIYFVIPISLLLAAACNSQQALQNNPAPKAASSTNQLNQNNMEKTNSQQNVEAVLDVTGGNYNVSVTINGHPIDMSGGNSISLLLFNTGYAKSPVPEDQKMLNIGENTISIKYNSTAAPTTKLDYLKISITEGDAAVFSFQEDAYDPSEKTVEEKFTINK